MTPKHIIIVEHVWGVPRLYPEEGGGARSVRICDRCGLHEETLQRDEPDDKRSIKEFAESTVEDDKEYFAAAMKEMAENFRRIVDDLRSREEELCEGTGFQNLLDFAEQLEKRYQGAVRANEVTLRIANHIIDTNNGKTGRKYSRKVLLAFRQGLVCDICDQVADSLDDLTEDHIVPRKSGGQSTLMNLRLVCQPCNDNKADKSPIVSDISPFAYEGEPCEHRVSCGGPECTPPAAGPGAH